MPEEALADGERWEGKASMRKILGVAAFGAAFFMGSQAAVSQELPSIADIKIGMNDRPDPVRANDPPDVKKHPLKYNVNVRNNGPFNADGVRARIELPWSTVDPPAPDPEMSDGCTFNSNARRVVCELGQLGVGDLAKVSITVYPQRVGVFRARGFVTSDEIDPRQSNNKTVERTRVR
jgi:hypothetical protein